MQEGPLEHTFKEAESTFWPFLGQVKGRVYSSGLRIYGTLGPKPSSLNPHLTLVLQHVRSLQAGPGWLKLRLELHFDTFPLMCEGLDVA